MEFRFPTEALGAALDNLYGGNAIPISIECLHKKTSFILDHVCLSPFSYKGVLSPLNIAEKGGQQPDGW